MTRTTAKNYLLNLSESKFIDWYNNAVIDPFGDFSFAIIRHNTGLYDICDGLLDSEVLFDVCRDEMSRYCEEDKYVIVADYVYSFNTIAELMESKTGEGILDFFVDDVDGNMDYIENNR